MEIHSVSTELFGKVLVKFSKDSCALIRNTTETNSMFSCSLIFQMEPNQTLHSFSKQSISTKKMVILLLRIQIASTFL